MKLRRAFGSVELIFVIIIILVVYYTCFHNQYGRSNPFADAKQLKTKQQVVDDKLEEIQNSKTLMNEQIKKNLEGEY